MKRTANHYQEQPTMNLTYKQLQASLKGRTTIKLNSKKEILEREFTRLANIEANKLTSEIAVKADVVKSEGNKAPRHNTPVSQKYVNKKTVASVTPIKKVECKYSDNDSFGYHTNVNHKRFTEVKAQPTTVAWSPSIIEDTVVDICKAANNVLKGFNARQQQRNGVRPVQRAS